MFEYHYKWKWLQFAGANRYVDLVTLNLDETWNIFFYFLLLLNIEMLQVAEFIFVED